MVGTCATSVTVNVFSNKYYTLPVYTSCVLNGDTELKFSLYE